MQCFEVIRLKLALHFLQPASASQVTVPPCPAQRNSAAVDQCFCFRGNRKPGLVPHSCTRKLEARRSGSQGHLQLLPHLLAWETQDSCLKKKKKCKLRDFFEKRMSLNSGGPSLYCARPSGTGQTIQWPWPPQRPPFS